MPMYKYFPMGPDGTLMNNCSSEFQSPWRDAVSEIGTAYQDYLQTRLHSAYVRGSVAQGSAIPRISDIDTFAIVRGPILEADKNWEKKISLLMGERHEYAQMVEIVLVAQDGISEKILFTIKTQSQCIYGVDLSPGIPNYKPSREIAFVSRGLAKKIVSAKEYLDGNDDSGEVMKICTWIMKAIIRSGFEIVMERENAYTRDLGTCVEAFVKYYEDRSDTMRRVLHLAINPSDSPEEVLSAISDLGEWLTKEIEVQLGQ